MTKEVAGLEGLLLPVEIPDKSLGGFSIGSHDSGSDHWLHASHKVKPMKVHLLHGYVWWVKPNLARTDASKVNVLTCAEVKHEPGRFNSGVGPNKVCLPAAQTQQFGRVQSPFSFRLVFEGILKYTHTHTPTHTYIPTGGLMGNMPLVLNYNVDKGGANLFDPLHGCRVVLTPYHFAVCCDSGSNVAIYLQA